MAQYVPKVAWENFLANVGIPSSLEALALAERYSNAIANGDESRLLHIEAQLGLLKERAEGAVRQEWRSQIKNALALGFGLARGVLLSATPPA